jgi:hypothetical protein
MLNKKKEIKLQMTNLTKQEKEQLEKVRKAKLEILFTSKDNDGNFLVYNRNKLNLRLAKEDKNRNIGDIYYVNDKILYSKWETESQIFNATNAWSIPLIVAKNVDVVWYKTPLNEYWINYEMIKRLLKEEKAKIMQFSGFEKKVYIPLKYWYPNSIIEEKNYEMTLLSHNPVESDVKQKVFQKYENRVGSWSKELSNFFETPYMKSIGKKLAEARNAGKIIYPESNKVFRAFKETPYEKVKVVLIGQDPYHDGNATGLI